MWFVVQHFKMMMLKYQEVLVVDLLQQLISNLVLRIEDIVIDDDNKKKIHLKFYKEVFYLY